MTLQDVPIPVRSPDLLLGAIGEERLRLLVGEGEAVRRALGPHVVLNVNSTATGGGVAEMLNTLLGYARGAGIDTRWVVPHAPPEFFVVTKRLHHMLHGVDAGLKLDGPERDLYDDVLRQQAVDLKGIVRPGDIVILHDPQTAGLAKPLMKAGARVAWRCHVGSASPNAVTAQAWEFLHRYLDGVPMVISRTSYLPDWVDTALSVKIAPSIDPLSPKNVDLPSGFAMRMLQAAGLLADGTGGEPLTFERRDGTRGRVERVADILQSGPPPPANAKLVVQVSRWDPLKDMAGVMRAFAEHVLPHEEAHLVLAGPNVTAVADDPEGAAVLQQCMAAWAALPAPARARVHLACLPMRDIDENALLVNSLQRTASVIVQKSLAEGFGLTVTEAMWKGRPVVASRVGGIEEQIEDGYNGVLIDDPHDLAAVGRAINALLGDSVHADEIGRHARQSVNEAFLPDRHLNQWAELVLALASDRPWTSATFAMPPRPAHVVEPDAPAADLTEDVWS